MKFKTLKPYLIVLILINIFLSAWYVINKDILFHTDIARDFLVMEDIVKTMKPTLIGPRAGGISGVFHGPLWFYISLPAFIIGKGNPVFIGWFWVFLSCLSIFITYYFGKKLFNEKIGIISAFILSIFSISYTNSLLQPFGALILFPIFFFLFKKYLNNLRIKYLISALLFLGFIIQFQMAFGVPILVLTTAYLTRFLLRKKKPLHFFSFFILLIPLSTFLLFDLRHDFLQSKSIINYLLTKQKVGELNFTHLIFNRIKGFFVDGINMFPKNTWLNLPLTILFSWVFIKYRKKEIKYKDNYLLFFYFYTGYWVISLFFKGNIWNYYFLPFLPLTILIFISFVNLINKKIFITIFIYILIINYFTGIDSIKSAGSGWSFYHNLAKDVYRDANNKEFCFYPYSSDQLAYSEKYAISFTQREFIKTKSNPFKKCQITYLIYSPPPKDRKWLNGEWWKKIK
jgi:hypothetical protein